jgi:hypothetical protein
MHRRSVEVTTMTTRIARTTMVLAFLAAASQASAACGWFGTQLECGVGSTDVVIGTQALDDPGTMPRPQSFMGGSRLLDDRGPSATPPKLQLQNFGNERGSCREIENANETYCY